MHYALGDYFFDPLIRASSLGSLFLGAASGLLGALLVLRRASLMAETMSHASYPGLMLSVMALAMAGHNSRSLDQVWLIDLVAFAGAWLSSMLGLWLYSWMVRMRMGSDSALCWVLASFLGVGVLMASRLQFQAPRLYQRAQSFLYGQAATLMDGHVLWFAALWLISLMTMIIFFRPILCGYFDPMFARAQGQYPKTLRLWIHLLTSALLVTGIRAGGVLVMAALLVAPATSARFFSRNFKHLIFGSMILGAMIGLAGNMASLEIDGWASVELEESHGLLPTGPAIAIVGCSIAILSCIIAPQKGWIAKYRQQRKLKQKWLDQLQNKVQLARDRSG